MSAFSLDQGYNTFSLRYEGLLSTRVSNVARVSLKRAPVGGRLFRPNFERVRFAMFIFAVFFYFMLLSSGFTFGDYWRLPSGFTLGDNGRLSSGFTFGDKVTFSVIQLSV